MSRFDANKHMAQSIVGDAKVCLQDLLDRINHTLRNENRIYFATTYDRDIYKQDYMN